VTDQVICQPGGDPPTSATGEVRLTFLKGR
jgi:hypothetical protein